MCQSKNVMFKVNQGWTVAKALLNHERSMIASAFGGGGKKRSMRDWARGVRRVSTANVSPTPRYVTASPNSRWIPSPSS